MANLKFLEIALNNSFTEFKNYFSLILRLYEKVIRFWDNLEKRGLFEEIKDLEEQSNASYSTILNDVTWNLSQHHPNAENLRFFIAILLSIKDLERCADYGMSISHIIRKHGANLKGVMGNLGLLREMVACSGEIRDIFIRAGGRISYSEVVSCADKKRAFMDHQRNAFMESNANLMKFLSQKIQQEKLLNEDYEVSTVTHLILIKLGRSVDHIFNVIDNFHNVTEPNGEDIFVNMA